MRSGSSSQPAFTRCASAVKLPTSQKHQNMEVAMHLLLTTVFLTASLGGGPAVSTPLQGKWKVAAVFEDGNSLSERDIATQLFANGMITIDGPVISFLAPGSFESRK